MSRTALPLLENAGKLADGRKIACFIPWQNMIIGADGNVSPCSFYQGFGNSLPFIGDVNQQSIMEIWNGPGYQNLRRFMLSEEGKNGCPNCLAIKQGVCGQPMTPPRAMLNEDPALENSKAVQNLILVLEEIAAEKTEIQAVPASISYTNSHACNFRCTMCYQDDTRDLRLEKVKQVDQQVLELMDYLIQVIAGGGEPLMLPIWRRFLNEYTPERNPVLTFATTTNGSLLDEKTLAKVKKFPSCILNFSLDATHKQLFEEIRVRSNWDVVHRNLLNCLAERGPTNNARFYVSCCMTVMRSNFSEIPAFLRMMAEHRVPVGFSPLNVFPIDEALTIFNDAHTDLHRFRNVLDEAKHLFATDPVLQDSRFQAFLKHMEALENMIPFALLDVPHFKVTGVLPAKKRRLINPLEVDGVPWRMAFFDEAAGGQIRYWAPVERDGTFTLTLPAGTYMGALTRRNQVPLADPYWRMGVVARSDRIFIRRPTIANELRRRLPKPIRKVLSWVRQSLWAGKPVPSPNALPDCESKQCAA